MGYPAYLDGADSVRYTFSKMGEPYSLKVVNYEQYRVEFAGWQGSSTRILQTRLHLLDALLPIIQDFENHCFRYENIFASSAVETVWSCFIASTVARKQGQRNFPIFITSILHEAVKEHQNPVPRNGETTNSQFSFRL